MQDPISDMLTRIRNAQAVDKETVSMPLSTIKVGIAQVLKEEGYIIDFGNDVDDNNSVKKNLTVTLKYFEGLPAIAKIERVSRPGLRIYRNKNELPRVQNGLGIAIISTSKGIMTDKKARKLGQGGEVLVYVS